MNNIFHALIIWLGACLCLSSQVAAVGETEERRAPLTSLRRRRSDDSNVLAPVVAQHSRELGEIKAELTSLKARLSELEHIVCFTVRFSRSEVTGLGHNQPVIFDSVGYNAGGGYDKTTGIFTVPASGTYVLTLSMQRDGEKETTIIMAIKKGTTTLGVAEAGYSPYEHGTMVVTAHLNQGDAISVQAVQGSVVYGSWSTSFSGFRISP